MTKRTLEKEAFDDLCDSPFPAHIVESSTKGRAYFASRSLPSGTLVCRSSAIAIALDTTKLLTHCSGCARKVDTENKRPCMVCGQAVLCARCFEDS